MSVTRRSVLNGVLVAPFLAGLAGTAFGATPQESSGTVSGGWVELRWTPQAREQLQQLKVTAEPVAPAVAITDNGTPVGVRFPIRSATGDPSLSDLSQAQGSAVLDGGMRVRGPMGQFEFAQLRPTLGDELGSGTCTVNGVEMSAQSLLRCSPAQGRLLASSVPAGQPLPIRIESVPVYPTPESLAAFTSAFDQTPTFTPDTVVGYLTAEAVYHPAGVLSHSAADLTVPRRPSDHQPGRHRRRRSGDADRSIR